MIREDYIDKEINIIRKNIISYDELLSSNYNMFFAPYGIERFVNVRVLNHLKDYNKTCITKKESFVNRFMDLYEIDENVYKPYDIIINSINVLIKKRFIEAVYKCKI